MENNNQKNQMQQGTDKMSIGEVKETGKEALKLGANAAAGNWAGAAKSALNLAKNKKVRRKIIIHALLQILVPILIIVLVATSIFSIGVAIKDTLVELGSKVSTSLTKMWQWLTNDYWIDLSKGTEYIINAETGETLGTEEELKEAGKWNGDGTITDEEGNIIPIDRRTHTIVENYIKELGNQGVSISDLRLLGDESTGKNFEELMTDPDDKELIEKYISEFVRADIITQQFHKTRGTNVIATDGNGHENVNKVDGGVYLYRTKIEQTLDESDFNNGNFEDPEVEVTQKEYRQMEYIDIEDFQEMVANDDKDIRYKFSLDKETDELLVAKITETKKVVQSTKVGESSNESFYEIEEIRLPYKDYISKFAMPYEFLINLCEITQNPEFVYHVALLARDTEIILAIQDDTTIERTTVEVEEDVKDYINYGTSDTASASVTGQRTEKTKTITTITTQTPRLLVEYADTWSFYEESTYTKSVIGTKQDEGPVVQPGGIGSTLSNFHPATDTEPKHWTDTFTTETRTTTEVLNLTTIYNPPIITSVEKSKQFLGLLRNETGECPYNCYNKSQWDNAKYCAQEAIFDEEGYNVAYKIPNMERYEMPLNKLESGLEMLYAMLQSNTSGYDEEDKLVDNVEDSYDAQQAYIANEDYESAYVVKMQGLVEHLRYLMTFPTNEVYTIKSITLESIFGNDDDNDDDNDNDNDDNDDNDDSNYIPEFTWDGTTSELIELLGKYAQEDMKESGILASVTVAQALLESGWGKSQLSATYNNYFGIKKGGGWDGPTVTMSTKEVINGQTVTVKAEFRVYDTPLESIKNHSEILKAPRYEGVVGETDYRRAITIIKRGGYATDPGYVDKICQIIEENGLTRFDQSD